MKKHTRRSQTFNNSKRLKIYCANYRGIALTATISKLLVQIVANWVNKMMESIIPDKQSVKIEEPLIWYLSWNKYQMDVKSKRKTYFLHLFISREHSAYPSLILKKFGCPDELVIVISTFYSNDLAESLANFKVRTGVQQ